MTRKTIRLKFVDAYPGFIPQKSALFKAISKMYDIELCERPDYVIVQPYGHEHLKYDCIKIFFTGENVTPDFNLFDYAIGFDYISFGDRYVRVPLWSIRSNFPGFRSEGVPSDGQLLKRKFCSFVVSNPNGNPIRTKFFRELSKYKRVDSGGRYLNNIGGAVSDKMSFVGQYKFNIAFENSSYPGYTTEKIMEPLSVWSVPIYWGDPLVGRDFREDAIIRIESEADVDCAVDEIVRLDNDDDAYLAKCKAPCLVNPDKELYMMKLEEFFQQIFEQPIRDASRLTRDGWQGVHYRAVYHRAFSVYDMAETLVWMLYRRPRDFLCKVLR